MNRPPRGAGRSRVEVLYFAGCPNYEVARELVRTTAATVGLEPRIELLEVKDEDDAVRMRFLGSPTVRVDGRDVEPGADARRDFSYSCRLYRTDVGVSELPDAAWIREALTEAAA